MSYTSNYKSFAEEIKPSENYKLRIDGKDIFVHRTPVSNFAALSGEGEMNVEVESTLPFKEVKIRPLRLGISFTVDGNKISFKLKAPAKVSIEIDDQIHNPLFLLVNPPEREPKPSKDDPNVLYFESGKAYDAGAINLNAGQTMYIEEGAVVFGQIEALQANNLTIRGRGILDGSKWEEFGFSRQKRMMKLIDCENITIEGITIINGPTWHVVPTGCRKVSISNLNIITYTGGGDGIDVVACQDTTIENCFIRSKDDCIAVKAFAYYGDQPAQNVERLHVKNCVFWNAEWGNALEIGYETRCEEIKDIVFEDSDIIHCEFEGYQSGGTFTIHNGDRAVVSNVRYENLRVEDSREKLIDIKVLFAQYSRDDKRGQVHDIHFKDIKVVDGPFPVSIIRGFDGEHMISNVTVENMVVHGQKVNNATDAKMVVELSRNVTFK